MNLRISEHDFKAVRRLTSASFRTNIEFPPETGCLLLVARNPDTSRPSLIVTEVIEPGLGDVSESSSDGLVFSSTFLRRALLQVREKQLAGFITVHTHPLADETVGFSRYDDAQDPKLMQNLYELQPAGIFGSLVLGRNSVAGRTWPQGESRPRQLDRLFVVGERLEIMPLSGVPFTAPASVELFDRALALTGSGALSCLAGMTVGVVGTGGTGSLMIELLARAGAGEIVGFDFDVAEYSNLNRVLHLRETDALQGRRKLDRFREVIAESGLPTRLSIVSGGDVTVTEVARELTGCDLIIGCVDRDWPRLVLCEVSYRYLIPLIDIGSEIGLSAKEVQSVDARVSIVGPGSPCLLCSGVVSRERVRLEGYSLQEQERILKMGYNPDFHLKAPAVMDLNMRAASLAMLIVRHLLQPYMLSPLPHTIKEAVTNFSMRTLRHSSAAHCPICTGSLSSKLSTPLTTRPALAARSETV
jgi:molybdopterin-synthase adenylyltransferase